MGSKTWVDAGTVGFEPGWSSDDMNFNFSDLELPFAGGALTPVPGAVAGTNYIYVLTSSAATSCLSSNEDVLNATAHCKRIT